MPPKKQSKPALFPSLASPAAAPMPAPAPALGAAVRAHLAPSATSHHVDHQTTMQPLASYESPLKKLKKTLIERERNVIDRIDDLRAFIKDNDMSLPDVRGSIRIQARVLWFVAETVKDMHFLRIYLSEHQATEPLQQQQQEFKAAQRNDPYYANQYLITVSLFEVDKDDPELPEPGDVIVFPPTKLSLHRNCIQANAKLQSIVVVAP